MNGSVGSIDGRPFETIDPKLALACRACSVDEEEPWLPCLTPVHLRGEAVPMMPKDESSTSAPAPKRRATAESMAAKQREISVSEFFTKNRHLLGFDNPAKALLSPP